MSIVHEHRCPEALSRVNNDRPPEDRPFGPASASVELHRLLVESVADYAIFALDATGHVLSWNLGAQRLKGYLGQEIIGKHFSIFYPPEDIKAGKTEREIAEAIAVGRVEDEGWRVRKDGTRFWASVVITALRGENGEVVGFAKVTRDLTARRDAEQRARDLAAERAAREAAERHGEELAELNTQLRQLFVEMRATADRISRLQTLTARLASVVSSDSVADTVVQEGVAALGAATGVLCLLTPEGDQLEIVCAAGVRDDTIDAFRLLPIDAPLPLSETVRTGTAQFLESKGDVVSRYPTIREANEAAPTQAWIVLPMIVGGRGIGGLSFGFGEPRTFTEADRQFATALAQQASQALERARLYTAEQAARAEAETANRAKAEFLATMSHELRTPLNAIAGYAELLEMGIHGAITDAQRGALRRIQTSERHLLSLIEDILSFARIEAGRLALTTADVPIGALLTEIEPLVSPQLGAKSLTFEIAEPDPLLTARVDAEKTRQILINLLSNAIKFTPAGGAIEMDARVRADFVEITVRDTGVGIPPDKQAEIFDPFVQLGRTLANTPEGAGLGLAISRDLARAMGGELTVDSEVGVGSTFVLSLPRSITSPGIED